MMREQGLGSRDCAGVGYAHSVTVTGVNVYHLLL